MSNALLSQGVTSEIIRLVDSLSHLTMDSDSWTAAEDWLFLRAKINAAQIVVFAIPERVSGQQSVVRQLVACLNSQTVAGNDDPLHWEKKVAGFILVGVENRSSDITEIAIDLVKAGFTIPGRCWALSKNSAVESADAEATQAESKPRRHQSIEHAARQLVFTARALEAYRRRRAAGSQEDN